MIAAHIIPAQIASRSGSVDSSPPDFTLPPLSLYSLIRTRSSRRRTVDLSAVEEPFPKQSRRDSILKKLAGPRENAKRFLRFRSSGVQSPASPQQIPPRCSGARPVSEIFLSPADASGSPLEPDQGEMRSNSAMATEVLPRAVSDHPNASATPELTTPFPTLRNEKIVATGSGLTVGLALTEPILYLQGYDQNDPSTKKSAILRGQIHLKVTKCVKIKKISICFRGHAQTDWPDGRHLTDSPSTTYGELTKLSRYPTEKDPFPRQERPLHPWSRLFQPRRYRLDAERLRRALLPTCQTRFTCTRIQRRGHCDHPRTLLQERFYELPGPECHQRSQAPVIATGARSFAELQQERASCERPDSAAAQLSHVSCGRLPVQLRIPDRRFFA